ncbi:MAG: S8 family serine peptidase [Cytophagales bacterium]|nr:S8 family serine peptidase [Cytophagales bacterium]
MRVRLIFFLSLCLGGYLGYGQSYYWVDRDIWLNKSPRYCSEWLKACSYELTKAEVSNLGLSRKEQVLQFEPLAIAPKKKNLSFALEQIEGQLLIDRGITGKGVKIGVIDGGFLNAPDSPPLHHLFENDHIASYKDYITPDLPDYAGSGNLDDQHGTGVLKMIGGIDPASKIQFGLATEATYYLARTDHGAYEKRLEEDLLIQALEEMEKAGVRLVNISLGYAKGYKNPSENYTPEDMDGSSMIAKAVDHAFFEKNMLVVVAAGNEGNDKKWRLLSTPGDSKGALTVGATKLKVWDRMEYSSIGPDFLNYTKPDISCYSSYGTSYATPVITGLAACVMELYPDLTAREVKAAIVASGNLYPYGNNHLGQGVPQVSRLLKVLAGEEVVQPEMVSANKNTYELAANKGDLMAVYHKQDTSRVVLREISRIKGEKVKIWREKDADFTTVLIGKQAIEIDWRN